MMITNTLECPSIVSQASPNPFSPYCTLSENLKQNQNGWRWQTPLNYLCPHILSNSNIIYEYMMSSIIHQYIDRIVGVPNQFWGCPKRRRHHHYHSPDIGLEGGVCLLQYPYSMFRLCAGKVIPVHLFLCTVNKKTNSRVDPTSLHYNSAENWLGVIYMQQQSLHSCLTISSVNTRMYELRSFWLT